MAENATTFSEQIWDAKYWFPKYVNGVEFGWKDIQNMPGSSIYYPEMNDLHWGIVLGVLLVMFRYFLET